MGDPPFQNVSTGREQGVSIIICSRDRPHSLGKTLDSLLPVLRSHDEVVVVDSASTSSEVKQVAERRGVRVVRCGRPGLARARNAGVGATTAHIVAFTDDDCLVGASWTQSIEDAFDDPSVGCVIGRIEGETVGAGAAHARKYTMAYTAPGIDGQRKSFDVVQDPATIGAHGANLAFRRSVFNAAGRFDEMFGAGGPLRSAEDHDLIWRVMRRGWRTIYEPKARIVHPEERSRKQLWSTKFGYGVGSGAFSAKLAREEGAAGWDMLNQWLWHRSLRRAVALLRQRSSTRALGNLVQFAGVVVGAVRGLTLPLHEGHYGARRRGF